MASPLPAPHLDLPKAPELPDLPRDPLPTAPHLRIGGPGAAPKLPRFARRGGHRAPRPPLSRPEGAQSAVSRPAAPNIIHIHQAAPSAPSATQTAPITPKRGQKARELHDALVTTFGERNAARITGMNAKGRRHFLAYVRAHGGAALSESQRAQAEHMKGMSEQARKGGARDAAQRAANPEPEPTPPSPQLRAKRAGQYAQMRATLDAMKATNATNATNAPDHPEDKPS